MIAAFVLCGLSPSSSRGFERPLVPILRSRCALLTPGERRHPELYLGVPVKRACGTRNEAGRRRERCRGTVTPTANPDIRRRLRVLNPVGAPRRGVRPRSPRDGGALPEVRRSRLGRPQRGAVRKRRLGGRARRCSRPTPAPMARGGRDQRFPGGRAWAEATALLIRAARRKVSPRTRLRRWRRQPQQAPRRRALLRAVP